MTTKLMLCLLCPFLLVPLGAAAQAEREVGQAQPGPAGNQVIWAETYDKAISMAREIPGGRILLYFYEPESGDCSRMEALLYPHTSFFDFTRDKVPVAIDRGSTEGQRLAKRFRIPTVPAWIILTPEGILSGAQVGASNTSSWFGVFVESERAWADYLRRLEAEKATPEDLALVYSIAQETYDRLGDGLAEPRFRRVAANSSAPLELRERSLAYVISIEIESGRLDAAEKSILSLLALAQTPDLKERAELRLADIDLARGDKPKAVARLNKFKQEHPGSPNLEFVDRQLGYLGALPAPTPGGAQ